MSTISLDFSATLTWPSTRRWRGEGGDHVDRRLGALLVIHSELFPLVTFQSRLLHRIENDSNLSTKAYHGRLPRVALDAWMRDPTSLETRAQALATQLNVNCRWVRHGGSGARTDQAAHELGLLECDVIKFLVLRKKKSPTTVGVILRGNERLDVGKVRNLSGVGNLCFANPDFIENLTGFEIGGIPPFSIIECDFRYITRSLGHRGIIICGAGGHVHCGVMFDSVELRKIPMVSFADIAND